MAFQAQGGHGSAHQHLGIVRAVGLMAALTPADVDGGMIEDERPLLLDVALEADFLSGITEPELAFVDAAVRLMAIGAVDRTFLHPVVERFCKIRLLLGMAGHTQVAGPLLEHMRHWSGLVRTVAIGAIQASLSMRAGAKGRHFVIPFVTRQALLVVGLGILSLETDDLGFVAPAVDVSLTGAMAGCARVGELVLRALLQDVVRIRGKRFDYIFVTRRAVLHGRA